MKINDKRKKKLWNYQNRMKFLCGSENIQLFIQTEIICMYDIFDENILFSKTTGIMNDQISRIFL